MSTFRIFFIGLVAVALALSLAVEAGDAYAEEIDYENGVMLCEECAEKTQQVECSLTISPDTVVNGEVFTATVSYSPNIQGTWKERFSFRWPSVAENFDELTIRTKKFVDFGPVTSSFESVVAPSALNIKGTFNVTVRVSGDVSCRAKAQMTVQ